MRWPYKSKTVYDRIKRRFALFPVVIEDTWVWLEHYYSFSWEDYGGPNVVRFYTYESAKEWVRSWEEDDE